MKKRYYLTYSKELVKEPFIYQAGVEFKVKTNIRQASISDEIGIVALELGIGFFDDAGPQFAPIGLAFGYEPAEAPHHREDDKRRGRRSQLAFPTINENFAAQQGFHRITLKLEAFVGGIVNVFVKHGVG